MGWYHLLSGIFVLSLVIGPDIRPAIAQEPKGRGIIVNPRVGEVIEPSTMVGRISEPAERVHVNDRVHVTLQSGLALSGQILQMTDSTLVLSSAAPPLELVQQQSLPVAISKVPVVLHRADGTRISGQIVQVTAHQVVIQTGGDARSGYIERRIRVDRSDIVAILPKSRQEHEVLITLRWAAIQSIRVGRPPISERIELKLVAGWAGSADEAIIFHHSVVGGAARLSLARQFAIEPEFLYLQGPDTDRHLVLNGNVVLRRSRGRAVSYFVVGLGLFLSENSVYYSVGGGVRLLATKQLSITPEFRVGSDRSRQPSLRATVAIGYMLYSRFLDAPQLNVAAAISRSQEADQKKSANLPVLITAGIGGGAVSWLTGGFLIGVPLAAKNPLGRDELDDGVWTPGLVIGFQVGEAAGIPVAVHLANHRQGNLKTSMLVASGLAVVGTLALWTADLDALFESPGRQVVWVMIPVAQLISSILIERRTPR